MRIESVRIQNFRAFADETVHIGPYCCLVGPNGAGKSTVLAALNVFFRNSVGGMNASRLSEQDFHHKNTEDPIRITVTFGDLNEAARQSLEAYVRHDQLVVTAEAEWDQESEGAPVQQFGARLVMEEFAPYFERDKAGAKAVELKELFSALRSRFPDLPDVKVKADMAAALRSYEEAHPELCTLTESPDQFYGFTKGSNRIDAHCQWVFVPAVKDAAEEEMEGRNTALGVLLERTVRSKVSFEEVLDTLRRDVEEKYKGLLAAQADVLAALSEGIQTRLREWAHPGAMVQLKWNFDPSKSVQVADPAAKADVGEGKFLGDVMRLGHGLQRSFIVALLHELAVSEEADAPTLILGLEEPELYQHPPQARHLAAVLERLAKEGSQIIATTHSPFFVSGRGVEAVRMVRKHHESGVARVAAVTHKGLAKRLTEAMQSEPMSPTRVMAAIEQILQPSQNEMFFARVPVFVEGLEDVAFVSTYLHLERQWEEFRRLGCHFVVTDGKNPMSRPVAIASLLELPAFALVDGDMQNERNQEANRRDNGCILRLMGHDGVDPLLSDDFFAENLVMWRETIGRAVMDEIGREIWNTAESEARTENGLRDHVSQKHPLLVTATLEILHKQGTRSDLLGRVCEGLLSFARGRQSHERGTTPN